MKSDYRNLIETAQSAEELEQLRIKLLGKKSELVETSKQLSTLTHEEKRTKGAELNKIKEEITTLLEQKKNTFKKTIIQNCDYTFPEQIDLGSAHLITTSMKKLHEIFASCSFDHLIGPDIEDVYYNFEALNIPESHPARDNNDTFYMHQPNHLLRTQVTAVQIRLLEEMQQNKTQSTRSYSIGRVYRNDTHDSTHACSFHQIEGIIIEEGVTMQHLKGFLEYLFEQFFGTKPDIRFRPSFFPFTEPSCEVDIYTKQVNGKLEVTTAENGTPLELGGCGIIHPSILENFGMADKQAFAFGMGLERLIMIKHGIINLHDLYDNHVPTLKYIAR